MKKTVDKKNKFNNPLSGIPTKSLLITLFCLLFVFGSGFAAGYFVRSGCSSVTTAFAAETSYSRYTVSFPQCAPSGSSSPRFSLDFYSPRYPAGVAPNQFLLSNSASGFNLDFVQSDGLNVDRPNLWSIFSPAPRFLGAFYSPIYISNPPAAPVGIRLGFGTILIDSVSSDKFFTRAWLYGDFLIANDWQSFNSSLLSTPNVFYYNYIERNNQPQDSSTPLVVSVLNSSAITVGEWDAYATRLGGPLYVLPLYCSYSSHAPVLSSSISSRRFCCAYRFAYDELSTRRYIDLAFEFGAPSFSGTHWQNFLDYMFNSNFEVFNFPNNVHSVQSQDSYDLGFRAGYGAGESAGYNQGLAAGRSEKLEDITPWQHIVNGVNTFLNMQLLPGVRISIILSITFGLILVGFLLKFYLGG